MRFTVDKAALLQVLQNLVGIVPSKTTLQVLTNFLISLKQDALSVSATDLDISMTTVLKVNAEEDGEVAVNARKLYEIVRELPEGKTVVETVNNVLQIKSEKGFQCRIAGTDTSDFPEAPVVDSTLEFSLPSHTLQQMAQKAIFAVSQDNTRLSLNGVCWDIRDKEMVMVATDGHRLGCCTVQHKINAKGGKNVIVSPKSVQLLSHLVAEKESKEVKVTIGGSYISFSANASTIASKLIQGPYPNYDQVIPKGNNKKASMDRAALMAAIRRVSILSSAKTHQVKFSLQKDVLELSAVNRDYGGEAIEKVPASYGSEPLEIGFNAGFFLEILKLTDTPRVQLAMNSPISACLFYPETDKKTEADYFFLLMPLRLLNN